MLLQPYKYHTMGPVDVGNLCVIGHKKQQIPFNSYFALF